MKKLILDLDTGVDDALAISYALGSPEVELIGITGTYGNVLVEQGVRNALAVTDLLGHPEVKVYQGLSHSSTTDHFEVLPVSAFIHGDNGIGDVDIPDSNRSVETESAVDFIIDAVKTYGKDLVYVPTGPMTNIEAALKKAPEIKDEIGQIVLMGGALTVPGNCNACMEANISQDPEAADYLFRLRPARSARRRRRRRPDARHHARHQHEGRCGRPDPRTHHRRRNPPQRPGQDHEGRRRRGRAEVPQRIHDPHLRPRRKSAVNDGSRGKRSTERFPRNPHHGITIEIIATQHHKNQAKKRKKN